MSNEKKRSVFEKVGLSPEDVAEAEAATEAAAGAMAHAEPPTLPAAIETGIDMIAVDEIVKADAAVHRRQTLLADRIIGALDELRALREKLTQLRYAVNSVGSAPDLASFQAIAQRVMFVEQEFQRVLNQLLDYKNELMETAEVAAGA